jgi:7,8-dihydropterin-6-yl-methyl-4-(beta-D-ribofuranosyl)aminobenzene 5'-phosphate synthase
MDAGNVKAKEGDRKAMKLTIIYDNISRDRRLAGDWGFACLVEAGGRKILFDTGANGYILINNMKYLNIRPADITDIFISHDHWDHTGGLQTITDRTRATCYIPESFIPKGDMPTVRIGKAPREIHDNIWSTGTLADIEQALVIRRDKEAIIVAGCSHPGVEAILAAAGTIGKVTTLVGGLHGFDNFEVLEGLSLVCPTHCTQHIEEIRQRYPGIFTEGGAGSVFDI